MSDLFEKLIVGFLKTQLICYEGGLTLRESSKKKGSLLKHYVFCEISSDFLPISINM